VNLVWYGRRGIKRRIKKGLWIIPLKEYLKLDVVKRVFSRKKCVSHIGKRGREYGNKIYFYHYNGKWLMDFHGSLLMFLLYFEYEKNIF
jgi:hypothetical protein